MKEKNATDKESPSANTRRTPLSVLLAHKWAAAVSALLVIVVGAVVTLLWPATYESSMKVLLSREGAAVSAADKAGAASAPGGFGREPMSPDQISDEEFSATVELVLSDAVLSGVAGEVKPTAEPSLLRQQLTLTPHYEAHAISVVCSDRSSERAAQILNLLFQKYDAHLRQLARQADPGEKLREQSAAFNRKLAEAQKQLREIEARAGVTDVSMQRELLMQQYYQTLSQLNAARTDLREAEQRVAVLQTQIAAQPAQVEASTRTQYTQASAPMRQELAKLEAERTQLLARQNPDPRLVRDLDQRIEKAKELIAREERAVPQERAVALNSVHQRLTNDLLSAQANQTALGERQKALGDLLAQIQARLQEVERKSAEKSDLDRARAAHEEAYTLYSKKAQEAELLSVTSRRKAIIATLTEAPAASLRPVSPQPLVNFSLTFALGLLIAVASAYVAESRRPRSAVRAANAPRAALRVLAKIPEV